MLLQFSCYFLLLFCLFGTSFAERSFKIDYENHQFLKDGKPFRYIAGQIEYFRIPPEYWQDRLMRLRHAGLNAIQIYVPWNFHETFENQFIFSGAANITEFIRLAEAQNLFVILRPGPYICAEWENGGLPYWLIKKKGIQLRVYNQPYINAVENYFNHLFPLIKPLMYSNGGPVLMVQIENEYGSYNCDKKYLGFLRDLAKKLLGNETLLYTTDPPAVIECGSVDGAFATVDFGVNDDATVKKNFEIQQKYAKGGPIVNSEFYPGWFTVWNYGNATLPTTQKVIDTMTAMYNSNASFSFYMFHGGTNFEFWNGAEVYGAVITSYDYGAPVAENGAITPQYLAIQDFIKALPNWDSPPMTVPQNNPVRSYGTVTMQMSGTLLSAFLNSNQTCQQSDLPLSFEQLDHPYGFVLYQTKLGFVGSTLKAENIKDHGYVYINNTAQGVLVGNLDKFSKRSLPLRNIKKGDDLNIIVENRGRQTFLSILDSKGLLPNVTLGNSVLTQWNNCPIDLNKVIAKVTPKNKNLEGFKSKISKTSVRDANPFDYSGDTAGVYTGGFDIVGDISDTWFNPGKFRKGQLFINGFNVGRYWPTGGPQTTLYVPASMLQRKNSVILTELLGSGSSASTVSFDDKPSFN